MSTKFFLVLFQPANDDSKDSDSGKSGSGQLMHQQQHKGVVLLTVLNATAEDSGLFWCVADNGIGGREVRNATYLLVRRKFESLQHFILYFFSPAITKFMFLFESQT